MTALSVWDWAGDIAAFLAFLAVVLLGFGILHMIGKGNV